MTDYRGWKKDGTDDSRLVRDFAKVLEEADVWVTYNGNGTGTRGRIVDQEYEYR